MIAADHMTSQHVRKVIDGPWTAFPFKLTPSRYNPLAAGFIAQLWQMDEAEQRELLGTKKTISGLISPVGTGTGKHTLHTLKPAWFL